MTATLREETMAETQELPKGVTVYEKGCPCEQHGGEVLPWTRFYKKIIAKDGLTQYCADYYKAREYTREIAKSSDHPLNPQRLAWLREHGYLRFLVELGEIDELEQAVQDAKAEHPMREVMPLDTLQIDSEADTPADQQVVQDVEAHLFMDVTESARHPWAGVAREFRDGLGQVDMLDMQLPALDLQPLEDRDLLEGMPVARPMSQQVRNLSGALASLANDLAAIENSETTSQATIVQLTEQLAGVTSQLRNAEGKLDRQKKELDETLDDASKSTQAIIDKQRAFHAHLRSVGFVIPKEYEL